mgnify:CR=1 FL=1
MLEIQPFLILKTWLDRMFIDHLHLESESYNKFETSFYNYKLQKQWLLRESTTIHKYNRLKIWQKDRQE